MTIKETGAIIQFLATTYPKQYGNLDEASLKMTINIWHDLFEDDTYEEVRTALKSYMVSDGGYAPTIGQLKDKLTDAKMIGYPTAEEAWSLVRKAIGNGIYGAKEEFDNLPPICQKLVADPMQLYDWAMLDNEGLNVAKSVFLKRYPQVIADEKFQLALPKKVAEQRKAIADNQSKIKMLAERVGK